MRGVHCELTRQGARAAAPRSPTGTGRTGVTPTTWLNDATKLGDPIISCLGQAIPFWVGGRVSDNAGLVAAGLRLAGACRSANNVQHSLRSLPWPTSKPSSDTPTVLSSLFKQHTSSGATRPVHRSCAIPSSNLAKEH